jgi:hypothetical protein
MLVDIVWYLGVSVDIWIGASMNMVQIEVAFVDMVWYFVLVVSTGYHCWIMVDMV